MTDDKTRQLENRIDKLESTIEKMMPSRRDALKMGGAALVGGAAMSGTASAGTNQVGTIGSQASPVDLESEDINNADTVTTQDLVVNGTATGPFGSDLQGCRVFLSSDQSISAGGGEPKIQFDSVIYDSDNNFDTSTHNFTCPTTGIYFVNVQVEFSGGSGDQDRFASVGDENSGFPNNEGGFTELQSGNFRRMQTNTMNEYSQGDKIAGYGGNRSSADTIDSGNANFDTFMEVVLLGTL